MELQLHKERLSIFIMFIEYLQFYVIRSLMVAISSMAECESESKIMPYCFELVSVSKYSDDESDSSES